MPPEKRRIDVMVSSTTYDLGEHRRRVGEVISRFQMVPRIMDLDSTTGKDGVTYSLDLVDEAEIYILLLGFRYGHVPDDPRNPKQISITQMEYERALEREAAGELCVLPFLMDDKHPLLHDHVETDASKRAKLEAFRAMVSGKQLSFFKSIDELEKQVMQTLSLSPCVERVKTGGQEDRAFEPRGGELLDGRYIFGERLGQGGNGEVWKAEERLPDGKGTDTVAIKLLKREISANPKRVERFKHEISIAKRLKHPHIIRTTHWGEVGGQFYAVMDYVEGQTLRSFMAGRVFSEQETVRYLRQVAEALDYAHKQGVIHRDVKPENILVQADQLFLGDFGLAVSPEEDDEVTESGEWVGTKKYMAPEQWDSQPPSAATDEYALGFIAYEMLTGEYPYDASSHARLLTQHLTGELPSHARLAPEVLEILRRATHKKAVVRYSRVSEFISELEHWRLNPTTMDAKILKYLDGLRGRIKGDAYESLFVDLEGDIRAILPPRVPEQPAEAYTDPYMDDLLNEFVLELDAERHAPQPAAAPTPVPNILEQLVRSERVVLVGEPGAGKSFILRRLVMEYIKRYAALKCIPVFVPLNAFKGEQSFEDYIRAGCRWGISALTTVSCWRISIWCCCATRSTKCRA